MKDVYAVTLNLKLKATDLADAEEKAMRLMRLGVEAVQNHEPKTYKAIKWWRINFICRLTSRRKTKAKPCSP